MKISKYAVWSLAMAAVYCAWAVSPVSAHAELVRSIPESNAVLAKSPAQVELLFSEPLEPAFSKIKVYDTNGAPVDLRDSSIDPSDSERETVSLPSLPDGVYTVSWQAQSQTDGHTTAGSFPFAIGNVNPSSMPAAQNSNFDLPLSALVAKWLLLAAAALLAGQFPFILFIWEPALKSNNQESQFNNRNWNNLYKIGLAATLLAIVLGILSQAGQATGQEFAIPWAKETIQVLTETRVGIFWLARTALVLIGFWVVRSHSTAWKRAVRFIIGLALLLSISLTSHAATDLHPLFPVLDDWLHIITMAIWLGGLVHLLMGLAMVQKAAGDSRTKITATLAKQFSLMALPSVGILGLTGMYSAGLRVGTISSLFDTLYGSSLLTKQIFVAALLIMAAINLLIISPGLTRDKNQAISDSLFIQRFRKIVLFEVIFAGLLLASISILTYLPPAVTEPPQTTIDKSTTVDDLNLELIISPGLVGQNTVTVNLSPNKSIQSVKNVILTFVPIHGNIPPSELQLVPQGNGIYSANGSNIGFAGKWLVEVAVRRENKFDAIVTFDFNLQKNGSSADNKSTIIYYIAIGLLALNGLLILLNLFTKNKEE